MHCADLRMSMDYEADLVRGAPDPLNPTSYPNFDAPIRDHSDGSADCSRCD